MYLLSNCPSTSYYQVPFEYCLMYIPLKSKIQQIQNYLPPQNCFFLMFIYFLREKQSVIAGSGRERGWHRIQSRLLDVSTQPDAGLELVNREIMTSAEVRRLKDWATQVPLHKITSLFWLFFCAAVTNVLIIQTHNKTAPFVASYLFPTSQ